MKISSDIHSFPDRKSLTDELTTAIIGLLGEAIEKNGEATLMVSGGSTPIPLFQRLSTTDISWQNITVGLVDERWVSPANTDSNEHLVRKNLLQNRAAEATFIGMKNSADTATEGETECAIAMGAIHRPFDVLILGMGDDGHTASLFPGAAKLPQATDIQSGKLCISIAPHAAPHKRMTLTLPAILDARQIFLHITGQNKKNVLQQAMADGAASKMPIRFILKHRPQNFHIYWAQ